MRVGVSLLCCSHVWHTPKIGTIAAWPVSLAQRLPTTATEKAAVAAVTSGLTAPFVVIAQLTTSARRSNKTHKRTN